MGTARITGGKSGVDKLDDGSFFKQQYGHSTYGSYDYVSKPAWSSASQTGAGDNARWETSTVAAERSVSDLGRSADERRIFLIAKGMSDVPSYNEWRTGAARENFKMTEWGNQVEGGYIQHFNDDVYAYHNYLDNKFGGDSFSRNREGTTQTNAATSTDPAVQALRNTATTRDTGGTQAVDATAAEPKRRGRRGATLAALDSSVDKPTILGG